MSVDAPVHPRGSAEGVHMRTPSVRDAAAVYRLIGEAGQLERNSNYTYLLLCSHFAETCVVAERDGALVGCVLGYRPPQEPHAMFVWQVGVAPALRGQGLGRKLLEAVLAQPGCRGVRELTATVSPDNASSLALFRGFARVRGVPCTEEPGFGASLFAEPHPDENLLRIGPLKG